MTKTISGDKARQGGLGRHLLLILIGGLILALAVWGGVEIYGTIIAPTEIDTQTTAPSG
ncbi:MAG TPA: hypothetical protein VMF90_13095 [Rhizobiaceae bacterium]|nr:hypothetical protein [Rhizobiaceae bacterium]